MDFSREITATLNAAEPLISQVVTRISARRVQSPSEPKPLKVSKEADKEGDGKHCILHCADGCGICSPFTCGAVMPQRV